MSAGVKFELASKKDRSGICVTRYPGQRILIGGNIIVKVDSVQGERVYIYVEAPAEIRIERPAKEVDKAERVRRGKGTI